MPHRGPVLWADAVEATGQRVEPRSGVVAVAGGEGHGGILRWRGARSRSVVSARTRYERRGTRGLNAGADLGPRAAHFQDSVELTLNKKGTITPLKLGPFDNGVVGQYVTIDARGGNLKLTVTDAFGAQGTSNGFKVQ